MTQTNQVGAVVLKQDHAHGRLAVDTEAHELLARAVIKLGDVAQQHRALRVHAQVGQRHEARRAPVEHDCSASGFVLGASQKVETPHRAREGAGDLIGEHARGRAQLGVDAHGDLARLPAGGEHL